MNLSSHFLLAIFGTDQRNHKDPLPKDILEAIDGGILSLPREIMQSKEGANILYTFVDQVRQLTPDHLAAMKKSETVDTTTSNTALIDRLLDAGVDPWMSQNQTADVWALALHRNMEDVCLRFLKHPNAPQGSALGDGMHSHPQHKSPLMPWLLTAVKNDMKQVAARLIATTTHPSIKDENGNTPLHLAKSVKMVELLLSAHPDLNLRNHNGRTIVEEWHYAYKNNRISLAESLKMECALMAQTLKPDELRQHMFERVAKADFSIGIRDGLTVLKNAGWVNPKRAENTQGHTIFFERAASLLNNNFGFSGEISSIVSSSLINKRLEMALSWLDREHATKIEQGALNLLLLFTAKKHRKNSSNKLNFDVASVRSPESQRLALHALDKMVEAHLVKIGSETASHALSGLMACEADLTELMEASSDTSLFSEWMGRIYRGTQYPSWWDEKHRKSMIARPDIGFEDLETQLLPHLPAPGDHFWSDPALPILILNRLASLICGTKKEAYRMPLEAHIQNKTPGDQGRIVLAFQPWIERIPNGSMMAAIDTPHGENLFLVICTGLPAIGAGFRADLLSKATQAVNHTRPRRSL